MVVGQLEEMAIDNPAMQDIKNLCGLPDEVKAQVALVVLFKLTVIKGDFVMRYAVTFSIENDWTTTDTFIVEADVNPIDMTEGQKIRMFEQYIFNQDDAKKVALDEVLWFAINIDDVNVNMVGE